MRKVSGYMTLEAALVVPMALCSIVLLIYFSYFLYGRCILTQDAYILAFRATKQNNTGWEEDPAGFVADRASDVLGKKYFGSDEPTVSAASNGKTVTVSGRAQARHLAMGRYFLKPQSGWEYEVFMKATKRETAKHIRTFMRLKDIGKEFSDGL